ncbi:MAG: leucine-rich repeat domain-containing protein [Clostridia bacterium]|nr:leucine-rich repeat domain-containing protein [Clostridia bacterium]
MKNFICALWVCLLLFSLCACGKQENEKDGSPTSSTNQPAVAQSNVGDETLQYPAKNDEFEYKVYETYIEITKYIGSESIVTVPTTIENLPVKSISDWSLEGCQNITSIILPDGLEEIGYKAFADCSALKEINIPNSVKEIGERAFHGCVSLVELTIPKSVTKIGEKAVGWSGGIGTYKQTDVIVKVYKASYAVQWVLDNYIQYYEVLG